MLFRSQATNGLLTTADGSGIVKLQSNGVTTNSLAWINFNGTNGSARSSYNISSVTRNGAGDYTINFSNNSSDANYSAVGSCVGGLSSYGNLYSAIVGYAGSDVPLATNSFRFLLRNYGGSNNDTTTVAMAVFGN